MRVLGKNPRSQAPAHTAIQVPHVWRAPRTAAKGETVPVAISPHKDGYFVRKPADAEYGQIQAAITVRRGRIVQVDFLQDPEDIDLSKQINRDAMPVLSREVIQIQAAHVDMVSGASFTTLAFRESVATALERARQGVP